MSFKDLNVEDALLASSFLRGEEQGRKRIALSMDRLDRSWDIMFKTTMSIVAITMATVDQLNKPLAKTVLEGMVSVLTKLTETMSQRNSGIDTHDYAVVGFSSFEELQSESNRIDAVGRDMFASLDTFGQAVIVNLLVPLPSKWKQHLQLLDDVILSCKRELSKDDAASISVIISEEQVRITQLLFNFISEVVTEPYELNVDKTGYRTFSAKAEIFANEWLGMARPIFNEQERLLSSSASPSDLGYICLSKVIQRLGFPDIASKIM